MKTAHYATAAARYLLGLTFVVFGANFFLHFIPQPPLEGPVAEVATALYTAGFMHIVKVVEISAGLALLLNRFVPLALTLLAPVIVGIVTFHLSLAPATGGAGYFVLALEVFLAYAYRSAYAPLFESHHAPALRAEEENAGRLQHSVG